MKLLAVALLILALAPHALANEKTAKSVPTTISTVDAAKLDAAIAHAQLITMAAQVQLAPFNAEIDRICAIYKIDRATLDKVKIDPATGEITRPVSSTATSAPPTLVAPTSPAKK